MRVRRILIVCFSQTGQLKRAAESVAKPLVEAVDVDVHWLELRPRVAYPFPWPLLKFFDQFPEAVHLQPPELEPLAVPAGARFDLVILAYTVWYLSPSPPITAFLKSEQGRAILRDTPVVTLVACRNMWLMAQERVKALLHEAGARHTDHIALTESCGAMASFITTPRWMLTGRTDSFCGLPPPGITAADIAAATRFGRALLAAMRAGRLDGTEPVLRGLRAATVDTRLITSEALGRRSFVVWGALVRLCGPQGSPRRVPLLLVYTVFLVTMICTLVPLSMLVRALLRPLFARRLVAQKLAFERPSGSDDTRSEEFSK
jgi:hypothetical protein